MSFVTDSVKNNVKDHKLERKLSLNDFEHSNNTYLRKNENCKSKASLQIQNLSENNQLH